MSGQPIGTSADDPRGGVRTPINPYPAPTSVSATCNASAAHRSLPIAVELSIPAPGVSGPTLWIRLFHIRACRRPPHHREPPACVVARSKPTASHAARPDESIPRRCATAVSVTNLRRSWSTSMTSRVLATRKPNVPPRRGGKELLTHSIASGQLETLFTKGVALSGVIRA